MAVLKYSPDQPRVPAGAPEGGQWAAGESGGTAPAAAGDGNAELARVMAQLMAAEAERQRQYAYGSALKESAGRVPLTSEEDRALNLYRGVAYRELNASLRAGGDGGGRRDLVAPLDSAMSKHVTPEEGYVFRGIDHVPSFTPGDVLADPGYLSTSVHLNIASNFNSAGSLARVVRILVPAGTHAVWGDGNEHELLLPRNTPLRVKSVTGTTVDMEVVR